jgi:hypothetical protein
MPKIISMFRILPSTMAGTSINIKQTITMTAKVSKGPTSLCLISAIITINPLDSHKQKRLFDLAQL